MNPLCANCFKRDAGKHCGKCGCRYCSPECQKEHWKASHKQWCGKAGQWGTDFELKPSPNKQNHIGIFALRPFKKYDTIGVDRPIAVGPNGYISDLTDDRLPSYCTKDAVEVVSLLMPELPFNTSPTVHRSNRDCLGNARMMWNGKVAILKAVRDIPVGEEICKPSLPILKMKMVGLPFIDRQKRQTVYRTSNYECTCAACMDPAIDAKMGQLITLLCEHSSIPAQPDIGKIKENVKKMVALANELGCSPDEYYLIYSKFYVAITGTAAGESYVQKDEMDDLVAKIKEIASQWYEPGSEEAKFGKTLR